MWWIALYSLPVPWTEIVVLYVFIRLTCSNCMHALHQPKLQISVICSLDNTEPSFKWHVINICILHTHTPSCTICWGRLGCQHWYQVTWNPRTCIPVYHAPTNSHTLLAHLCQHHSEWVTHPAYMYELPFTFSLSRRQRSHLADLLSHWWRNLKPKFPPLDSLLRLCKCSISPIKSCQPQDLKI